MGVSYLITLSLHLPNSQITMEQIKLGIQSLKQQRTQLAEKEAELKKQLQEVNAECDLAETTFVQRKDAKKWVRNEYVRIAVQLEDDLLVVAHYPVLDAVIKEHGEEWKVGLENSLVSTAQAPTLSMSAPMPVSAPVPTPLLLTDSSSAKKAKWTKPSVPRTLERFDVARLTSLFVKHKEEIKALYVHQRDHPFGEKGMPLALWDANGYYYLSPTDMKKHGITPEVQGVPSPRNIHGQGFVIRVHTIQLKADFLGFEDDTNHTIFRDPRDVQVIVSKIRELFQSYD